MKYENGCVTRGAMQGTRSNQELNPGDAKAIKANSQRLSYIVAVEGKVAG